MGPLSISQEFAFLNWQKRVPPGVKKVIKNDDNQRAFSRKEAANYLGITDGTLAVWACTGRYNLPYVKIGRLVKYRKTDLDAFISRRVVGS